MCQSSTTPGVGEFVKELIILLRFNHPHIVKFYGIYQHYDATDGFNTDHYFLVMQLADHGSLDKHVKLDGPDAHSLRRRLRWMHEVASAVHYLHREG